MTRNTTRLKSILARRNATIAPGAANALFARVIEDAGFDVAYVTGAGIANMQLGVPDIGLTTLTEIADAVAAISDVLALPLLVDADTGFGNALNMRRTVRILERAGAAGIQIEDQVFPKKCGHFSGKAVVPLAEMVQRIKAAVDARHDQDLQIVARKLPAPQVANIVFGGMTPDIGHRKLAHLGFGLVLYANASLQAALKASQEVLAALKRDGSLHAVADKLASFSERQRTVAKDAYDVLEKRYAVLPVVATGRGGHQ
jgi:2-methylisocitrate lyase-like PEP mutase family enzyme